MKLFELSNYELLNKVDSKNPTPGGGSVSALTIAYGIGLLRMVAHLTISKKKFQALEEEIKLDYLERFSKLEELKNEAIKLVDLDTLAFNKILDAFRLPKATDQDLIKRKDAIKAATIEAIEVPLSIARVALEAFTLCKTMYQYANKTATSDFGVGSLLLFAGLEGAILNVKTNLRDFSNQDYKQNCLDEVARILEEAKLIKNDILEKVEKELK